MYTSNKSRDFSRKWFNKIKFLTARQYLSSSSPTTSNPNYGHSTFRILSMFKRISPTILASSISIGLSIAWTLFNFKNVSLNFTLTDSYNGHRNSTWFSSSTHVGHLLHVLSSLGVIGEVYRPFSTCRSWLESLHFVMATRLSSRKNCPYIESTYRTSVTFRYLSQ